MDHQYPPSKFARLADHGTSGLDKKAKGSTPAGIGLSLGLGGGCSKSSGFTFLQMRELEHQSLVYIYIQAGLSVPYHLILPVWKSFASSYTGLNGGLHQVYSSNLQGCSSLYNEYKNSMEPEPGRCSRGVAKMLFPITSTVRGKSTAASVATVEKSILKLLSSDLGAGTHSTVSKIKDPFRT